MRIALLGIVIIAGVLIGHSAIQSVSEMTETRNERLCQIDPSFCSE